MRCYVVACGHALSCGKSLEAESGEYLLLLAILVKKLFNCIQSLNYFSRLTKAGFVASKKNDCTFFKKNGQSEWGAS
jgi:hypothetical protein